MIITYFTSPMKTACSEMGVLQITLGKFSSAFDQTYFRYPECTAHMSPFGARPGGLHGTPCFGTQKALRIDAKHTCPAQPVSIWHFYNPIASLKQKKFEGCESEKVKVT